MQKIRVGRRNKVSERGCWEGAAKRKTTNNKETEDGGKKKLENSEKKAERTSTEQSQGKEINTKR